MLFPLQAGNASLDIAGSVEGLSQQIREVLNEARGDIRNIAKGISVS